jgi:hypothetical protein
MSDYSGGSIGAALGGVEFPGMVSAYFSRAPWLTTLAIMATGFVVGMLIMHALHYFEVLGDEKKKDETMKSKKSPQRVSSARQRMGNRARMSNHQHATNGQKQNIKWHERDDIALPPSWGLMAGGLGGWTPSPESCAGVRRLSGVDENESLDFMNHGIRSDAQYADANFAWASADDITRIKETGTTADDLLAALAQGVA